MSEIELKAMFSRADKSDYEEGLLAYQRYNMVMRAIADHYAFPLERVVAAFCATSPNSDYVGNLRSVVSLLDGFNKGLPFERIQIATYRHCGARAWTYLTGQASFLDAVEGYKIRNFYHNIVTPEDNRYVTIDGHMVAAYRGANLTMKQAICRSPTEYDRIANACKHLAFNQFILPCQYQAIVWFVRKRVLNVKYDGQMNLFASRDDLWKTLRDVRSIAPFPLRPHDAQVSNLPFDVTSAPDQAPRLPF